MKNLDLSNPSMAKPRILASIGAVLPFILSGFGMIIAGEATPNRSILANPLALICLGLCGASMFLILIPRIFKWDWRAKFFGASLIYAGAPALFGVVPWLCIVLYSALPLWVRLLILIGYGAPIFIWCRKVTRFYRVIFDNHTLRNTLYMEDKEVVYYLQKGDAWLIEKKFKFCQSPSRALFISCAIMAFVAVPFISSIRNVFGLPFPHVFLSIISLPVILMCAGLSIRGYLIFYYYPWRIKKKTGKDVYVDMVTNPQKIE